MVCNLKGKVVFVSGASSGIGRDAAVAFAKAQCCVVLNGRNRLNLEETARLCLGTGGVTRDQVCVLLYLLSVCRSVNLIFCLHSKILVVCCDVSEEGHVIDAVNKTVTAFHKLDVLVDID